jgi:P-type E1-E2 ATPase
LTHVGRNPNQDEGSVSCCKPNQITEGKPKVTDIAVTEGFDEDEALKLVAAAETKSNHPLSNAILEELKKRKLEVPTQIEKFENLSGLGVKAVVNGKQVLVGTARLMKESNVSLGSLETKITEFLGRGETIMILAVDGKIAAIIGAADPIKANAKIAIERMNEMGIEVAMITGDNKQTAEAVAKMIGIKRVFAEVMPGDKAKYIKQLQDEGKFVAMVGDGVNDAPALATANIGIARGTVIKHEKIFNI